MGSPSGFPSHAAVLHDDESWADAEPELGPDDVASLLEAIALGRESARTEPLIDNDEVFAMARRRSARP